MFEQSQCTPAARMLETRLQREHLPHAERETTGDRHALLCIAYGAFAGVHDRVELVPSLGRRGFDLARDRPVKEQREQKRRGERLASLGARVRILEAAHEKLLDETVRVRF